MFTAGNDVGDFAADRDRRLQGRTARLALRAGDRALDPAAGRRRAGPRRRRSAPPCCCIAISSCSAENAQLSTPFVNLALVPEAASTLLMPLRIGYARAYEMFALGEAMDAPTALQLGIANRVVPLERLHAEAASVAARLAKLPAGSLAATKRLMRNAEVLTAQIGAESQMLCRAADDGRGARGLHRLRRATAAGLHKGCELGSRYVAAACAGGPTGKTAMRYQDGAPMPLWTCEQCGAQFPKAARRRPPARSARTSGSS